MTAAPAPALPRAARLLQLALVAAALLAFGGYFAIYLHYTRALLNFPFDYDQGEGFELYDTILFSHGEWPYRDNAVYPFYASNYPPLYHLLILPLVPFTGATYFSGRLVAFWGTLVTGAAIAGIVRRELRGRSPGSAAAAPLAWAGLPLLAAGAWYASNYVYHIGPLLRQHMLMVTFETLAIAFVARSSGPRGRRNLALALLFLLTAGYTKQLAVATAAAALAFVFLRSPRHALAAGLALAITTGAIYLVLDFATGGQWTVNTLAANVNEFSIEQTTALYQQWLRLHFPLILPAAGLLLYELYRDRLSAYSLWFAAATAIAALAGKWGAGESYFVTAVTATIVCATLALGRLWAAAARRSPRLGWLAGLLVPLAFLAYARQVAHYPTDLPAVRTVAAALGLPTAGDYVDSTGYTQLGRPPTAADVRAGQRIAAALSDHPGPVLSEEAGFALYAGKPVVGNPTQLLNLWKNGLLDSRALVAMIKGQEFGAVLFRAQFYPGPVLDAVYQGYEPVEAIRMNGFDYTLLLPRGRPP